MNRTGTLLAVAAALVWSATSPGLSYLIEVYGVPALTLALWRDAFIAAACLGGIGLGSLLRRRPLPRISAADWRGLATMGVVSIGIYHALFVYSVALNGAALAIVLIYLYPAFVTMGAALFFKERVGPQQIAALALAVLGSALLVRAYDVVVLSAHATDPEVPRVSWLGVLVGVASAMTHAGYVLYSQRSVTRNSPFLSLALSMFFGTITLFVLTLALSGPAGLLAVRGGPTPWLILLALALGPTLIGYLLFTTSLRHIPGRVASLIVVVEAPIATLSAVLLLGERIEPPQIVGMALVLAAAVLPGLRLSRREPAIAPAGD